MTARTTAQTRPLVLVADDDADLRALTEIQLADGFDVLQAANGRECVALASERRPDVILLDMMMPGMDGRQVLNELSIDPETRDIPVIFLSAMSETEDRVQALESGAVDFITKPAHPREFLARVGAAARTRALSHAVPTQTPPSKVGPTLEGRKAFQVRLDQEVARSRRIGTPLTMLLVDVDDMGEIIRTHDRAAGDAVLQQIASILMDTLRTSDVVFRYGGDEFAALLPDAEAGTAFAAAERCRHAVTRLHGDHGTISISIGVAEMTSGRSVEELMAKAEIALFRAKESGGNRSWRADDPRRHPLNPISLAELLTEREWAVLVALADRRTEQDIARRLGITPGTVRSHKARIRRKLQVAPDMRLSDFVRTNFRDLIARIGPITSPEVRPGS